jgi:hypothetical protein
MTVGARTRRIRRIAAAMPIVAELTGHTGEVDNLWWARREGSTGGVIWLATPFSRNGRGPQEIDDVVSESNYHVIETDLERVSSFGIDYRIDLWPGGQIHTLQVRADDAPALRAVQAWVDALADYPLADDTDHSEREWEFNHPTERECYGEDCCKRCTECTYVADGVSDDPDGICAECRANAEEN